MARPKLGKFKNFPVVILPDDCGEYIPSQPLPKGAILSTPLPTWTYMAVVGLVAVIVLMVLNSFTAKPKQSMAQVSIVPTATIVDIGKLLLSGQEVEIGEDVFVSYATFTPVAPLKMLAQTVEPARIKISQSPSSGIAGTPITLTLTSDRATVYTVSIDNRPVKNGDLDPGTNAITIQAPTVSGMHEISLDAIATGSPPVRQIFFFEVTK